MPTPPYAQLQYRVNGGSLLSTSTTQSGGVTISLRAASKDGWGSARWVMFDFPDGFPTPSGWTYDATNRWFYVDGIADPSDIVLSAAATRWGAYGFDLIVDDGTPNAAGDARRSRLYVRVLSPKGQYDTGLYEENEFGGSPLGNTDTYRKNLRAIEAALAAAPTTPTGTGFAHVTSGVMDAAATANASYVSGNVRITSALEVGASGWSATGTIRMPASGSVKTRRFSEDNNCVKGDSTDIIFGEWTAGQASFGLEWGTGDARVRYQGSAVYQQWSSTYDAIELGKGVIGLESASSPYGLTGGVAVTMADADVTFTAAQYKAGFLDIDMGATTGSKNANLPSPSSKLAGYFQDFRAHNKVNRDLTFRCGSFTVTATVNSGANSDVRGRLWVEPNIVRVISLFTV